MKNTEIIYSSSSSWGTKKSLKEVYGKRFIKVIETDGGIDQHSRTINLEIYLKKIKP